MCPKNSKHTFTFTDSPNLTHNKSFQEQQLLGRLYSVNTCPFIMVNTKETKSRADKYSMEDDISCYMCSDEVLSSIFQRPTNVKF